MNFPVNRLWGGLPTEKNLALCERYQHFYANSDHVLVIAPERPEGLVEMKGAFEDALGPRDWLWIMEEHMALMEEQRAKYGKEFKRFGDDFLNRFEAELQAREEENANGRSERQDAEQ